VYAGLECVEGCCVQTQRRLAERTSCSPIDPHSGAFLCKRIFGYPTSCFLIEVLTFSPPDGIRIPHVIQGAFLGIELMKKNIVVLRILITGKKTLTQRNEYFCKDTHSNIARKVGHSPWAARFLQMVIEPTKKSLLRRKVNEMVDIFSVLHQRQHFRVLRHRHFVQETHLVFQWVNQQTWRGKKRAVPEWFAITNRG